MKVLFISGLYPKEIEAEIIRNCKGNAYNQAANTFCWSIVNGFKSNSLQFDVLSVPTIPTFPLRYKKPYFNKKHFALSQKSSIDVPLFCTIIGIKDFSIKSSIYRYTRKWVEKNYSLDNKIVILTYSPSYYYISALKKIKKHYCNIEIACIVPDLVDDALDNSFNLSYLKKKRVEWEYKKIHECYDRIDKFILLSKLMEERIPQSIGKNIVMEGLANEKEYASFRKDNNIRTLMYSGALHKYAGVEELISAFMLINEPHFRLILCGDGPLKEFIKKQAQSDSRIIYKGLLPCRKDVLELQSKATALINPKRPDTSLAKYAFPSKMMEYMTSGSPMIGFKLGGVPAEYYDYMYVIPDNTIESLSKTIKDVLSKDQFELDEMARDAYDFIMQNKTANKQTQRMIEFLVR